MDFRLYFPKSISTLLIVILIANMALFAMIFHPKPAEAAVFHDAISFARDAVEFVWSKAKTVWEKTVAAAQLDFSAFQQLHGTEGIIVGTVSLTLALALHQLLAKMTNDIIAWINGGYRGKPRIMQDFGKALQDSLDEAGGVVMGAITGLDPKTLCDASWLKLKLAPAFGGPYAVPTFEEKVTCTFSGMADGLRKFKEDFRNGGWQSFVQYAEKQNNQLGMTILVAEKAAEEQAKKKNKFIAETTANRGYLAQKKCFVTKIPDTADIGTAPTLYKTDYSQGDIGETVRFERGGLAGWTPETGKTFIGRDLEEVMKTMPNGTQNIEEFKGLWIANGGDVDCKIVTPAEQISELATTAMQDPINKIYAAQNAMMNKIGEKAPAVIKPYVLAIGATLLNDMMKRGRGLVASAFLPPKKDRKNIRQSTNYLQSNTMLAQSAGATAASANDFRSFLLKAAIDFNQYIGNISRVMDKSDVLGRTQINKVEYTAMGGTGGAVTDQVIDLPQGPKGNDNTNWPSPKRELAGWLANIDCSATSTEGVFNLNPDFGDANGNGIVFTATIPPFDVRQIVKPINAATTTVAIATCNTVNGVIQPTQKFYTTYSAGKTFYEEAKWCGAYSQELPIPFASEQEIIEAITPTYNPYAITTCPIPVWTSASNCSAIPTAAQYNLDADADYEMRTQLFGYDDNNDGAPDRFIKENMMGEDTDNNGIPDTSVDSGNTYQFIETLVNSYSDLNGNGIINTIEGNSTGTKTAFESFPSIINSELSQSTAATTGSDSYVFGGYNQFGFSNLARDISNNTAVRLPYRFAGAQAVYFPPNGRIYIFGGMNENGLLDTVLEFDPRTNAARVMSAKLPENTIGLSGAYFAGTGKIYLFGGSTANGVRNWILEYNQQTDTMVRMNAMLPEPITNSTAVVSSPVAGQQRIYIIGGKNQDGLAQSSIIEYNPRAEDNSLAAVIEKRAKTVPRAYHAAYLKNPANPREIVIYGGQYENGLIANKEEFDPVSDYILNRVILDDTEQRAQMGYTANGTLIGGIRRDDASQLYPQGDIYYIPQRVEAMDAKEFMWQKYFSSKFENGSASLMNFKESVMQKDPTATILDPYTRREVNTDSDQVWMAPPFYPEMLEDAQELMEKVRVIRGYNYNRPWERNYKAALPLQLGSIPDDDPTDNRLADYEGSVSDVLSRYSELNKIYQTLFAGVTDESALEGVDPNMTWLTPEETNIKMALIGQRCPAIQPTATSSPDLIAKCPPLGTEFQNKYNMQKRFVFEPDGFDSKKDITTGFATNPFNNKKSSALAGVLNLDEMATQLQTASPDTNLVKLIRLRQILEQLQVPINNNGKTRSIALPGKTASTTPSVLTDIDIIQVDIPEYEKIQEYINDTKTRNLDVQTLIEAYGYTTAKEAYPEISKDLDNVWQDIVNQVTDKLKDVFLKRTEKELETARVEAQNRLTKFIEYVKDLNPNVKYEYNINDAGRIGSLINNFTKEYIKTYQVSADTSVLEINTMLMFKNPGAFEAMLARDSNGNPTQLSLTNDDRNAIIGTAAYKIKSLAEFVGIDTASEQFGARMSQYTSDISGNPQALDARVKNILKDVYLYYTGIYNFTDPLLMNSGDRTITAVSLGASLSDNVVGCAADDFASYGGYRCNLTTYEKDGTPHILNKDARTKLSELTEDFELMLAEVDKTKMEYQELSGKVKERGSDMDEMANLLAALESDYDKANACVGMPIDPGNLWKFGTGQLITYSIIATGGVALLAALGAQAAFWGIGSITLGATITAAVGLMVVPVIGVVGLAIAAFFGNRAKKKAEKKRRKQIARIANGCKDAMRDYNKHLGQLADLFLCNQQNPIYKDDAGQP